MTWNDTLIDISHFESFLSQAFKAFRDSPGRENLRRAMLLTLFAEEGTTESSFIKLFTALEAIA